MLFVFGFYLIKLKSVLLLSALSICLISLLSSATTFHIATIAIMPAVISKMSYIINLASPLAPNLIISSFVVTKYLISNSRHKDCREYATPPKIQKNIPMSLVLFLKSQILAISIGAKMHT